MNSNIGRCPSGNKVNQANPGIDLCTFDLSSSMLHHNKDNGDSNGNGKGNSNHDIRNTT